MNISPYQPYHLCLRPYYFVLQTFEQSLFVESCSRFKLLFGGYAISLRTLEEFPLPIIPPINESDYKPIKKEDIPIFNPKGYNESEFSTTVMPEEITYSTAMPTGMSHSITVSKEMPQPTTMPKKVSHSTTVPKEVSHSTTVSTDSTTVPQAISNTVPTRMSHPPTIVPTGMPSSSQDPSQVASAGITPPWFWAVLIICCLLLIIIIAFGSIFLYFFYKMKPMIIYDKIFIPAIVERSAKSLQSKKDHQIPAAATLADTKDGVENINVYDGLDLKTSKRSSKEAKSGKRKKQKKSNPFEPALKQPSKLPQTPKKSRKVNEGSISSKNTSNSSKDSIAKAYKGEINVDRSGKDSKDTNIDIFADENDKSKSNH
uniref:Uncharacterized protein n=1 Tax=Panagrolaimus davidi TaxID=227884 RepID=A0A914QX23_9BILA